jgi:ABC-type multidrug transport system fused ATPase/permease subunit
MSVGAFIAYLQLYLRFTQRSFRLPQMLNSIQSGGVAHDRLKPLLAPALPAAEAQVRLASFRPSYVSGIECRPEPLPKIQSRPLAVSVERLRVTYPGAASPALHDVSLNLPAGSFVAVTGPVGSGKSALARSLLGLYPFDAGCVLIEGVRADQMSETERAARIGYLPQDPYLFSDTVVGNVLMAPQDQGDPAQDEVEAPIVTEALAASALDEDVRAMPDGLNTQIGEGGIRLSGGQRQRIGLARSLAASAPNRPGLLVLDDPFSAVDVETEARIVTALRQVYGPAAPSERQATILLCSHRLAAFPQADRVIVLDRGRIVEQGTHEELMQGDALYAAIFRAQRTVLTTEANQPAGRMA